MRRWQTAKRKWCRRTLNGGLTLHRGRTSLTRLLSCGLAVLMVGAAFGGTARANTITVYSLIDPGAAGTCSLRDAITAANTKTAVNACAKGNGTDTIVFNKGLSGTITLGSTLPAIVHTLTIQGTFTSPPAITISGGGLVRLLVVNTGATLNLNYLALTDGNSADDGGGIDNEGAQRRQQHPQRQ
jgi:CSLREA domain-containing protein